MGKHDLSKSVERGSTSASPYAIHVHPDWKHYTDDYDADIALMVLKDPLTFSTSIHPICLWQHDAEPVQTTAAAVGWGRSESGAKHENTPRDVVLDILPNEDCFLKSHRLASLSSKRTFCGGNPKEGKTVCNGDSGSGLFIQSANVWYLRGIVSSSFVINGVCDIKDYAVYTNVLKFTSWINQIIAETKAPTTDSVPQLLVPSSIPKTKPKEVVCFVANSAAYRPDGGTFTVENLKPELCTTAVYNFVGLDVINDNIKAIDPWQDLEDNYGKGGFKKITAFKKTHPHLKVLVAIGGWNDGSKKYSELAADSERRKRFAKNSAAFLKLHDFDGLAFAWDHPAFRGGVPADKQNLVKLIKEISQEYKAENLYLAACVRPSEPIAVHAYDIPNLSKYLDAFYLMTFDFKGSWDLQVGLPAPLYGNTQFNVDRAVNYFLDNKAPAEKLIVGLPFSGKTFITKNSGNVDDETADDLGFQGPFLMQKGSLGYNEFCYLAETRKWNTTFDKRSSQSISKYFENGQNEVVVYDSPRSIANKARYVVDKQLGGVWAWSVDTDDFNGNCELDSSTYADYPKGTRSSITAKDFPLLRTANEALKLAAGIRNELGQRT